MTHRAVGFAVALFLLDASVTFDNVWPTPAIRWHGRLSLELAACVLLVSVASVRAGLPRSSHVRWLSMLWTALVLGRYAEVTAPALYGRDINLYWDIRFIPDVVAMATRVAPSWLIVASVAAAASILALLYVLARLAWSAIVAVLRGPLDLGPRSVITLRRVVIAASAAASIACAAALLAGQNFEESIVARPVTLTYARQAQFVVQALSRASPLADSPAMDSDLSRVRGADVLLVFVESYGAVSFERRDIAQPLAAARRKLETAARGPERDVVSTYVESPTFGGSSWLAHLSLISGVEVRDPGTNARLMTEHRDTLVRLFSRRGFRTVALMPGLRQRWPEGAFYGFDEIYGADRLAYHGPEFGWFAIPDQYSLERLDTFERNRSPRSPLFVFFPTLATHFPFNPTPPYQPEWRRVATARPFDGPEIVRAYAREPDWTNFAPGYVDAMSYEFEVLAGYLRRTVTRDFVMIVLGDHQPPALVTGEGATWNVPVHVISTRTPVLDRLLARGFRRGLTPQPPAITRMHALLPILLDAFGS
jgi:hypothetical protein